MPALQHILTVILSRELFDTLKPFLSRETLDISTVTSGKGSLVLLHNLAFHLIVVEHPLPDMEIEELLKEIRSRQSRCQETPVLVLTREDPEAMAASLDDPQATVHTLHASTDELLMLAASRLGVAARRASRLLVKLDVEVGAARILRACQSVNISESGLLLRTKDRLPLDTQVNLHFSLPYHTHGIQTQARVVRHTDRDTDGLVGLAVHFDSISEEDREAIATFIADRTAAGSADDERA